ncbi:uncharacterized protein LOC111716866 isoform X1 [Eurytemora carolleeae]|uniref:uncharacterized protein LOC111716866 isoform X1 n=1 Tax=Eurytemora carolleeae TaxID=1294199 RepID=UPI000C76C427|nr:uncharacterized protein LOC111716866 isoform X1 [Eurytemora carolleeae]|eukprot:XP_023348141.1 uncharacterized protein LOC111716866 isoform X1 [Eurytemora affinis]
MSMFSGLGNQISGFVSQKMGKGDAPPEGEPQEAAENGEEVPVEGGAGGGAMGGAMGFAQGLMMKAAAAKDGIKEKAGGLGVGGLQAPFGGAGGEEGAVAEPQYNEQGELIEGEEGVEGQQAPAMGFAAGLMMKAHSLKEGVKEKSSGINLGNVQAMGSMAGGVMSQVQGIIPGMRREEEVPDPAQPQEEYQEYQEEQYTE